MMVDPVGLIGGGFDAPSGDPGALLSLADRLDRHAEAVFGLGHDTGRMTTEVRSRARWEGEASERYSAFAHGAGSGIAGMHQPLSTIATHVRTYAHALHSAQQQVGAARASAHAAVSGGAPDAASHVAKAKGDAAQATASLQDVAEQSQSAIEAAIEELTRQWEATEPTRAWIEKIKAPWDAAAADVALDKLIEKGEGADKAIGAWEEQVAGLQKQWFDQEVARSALEHDRGLASDEELNSAWARYARKADALEGFTSGWRDETRILRGAVPYLKGMGKLSGATAFVGDVGTLVKPEDSGVMGGVDRGAAGLNAGLVAADLALGEIPGIGEAAMIGTGVYLGGDYLYHHWKPFRNVCNAVGHAVVGEAKGIAGGVASTAREVGHWLGL